MADEHTPDEPASEPPSEDHADHSAAPGLPEIRDEAGDTPRWVHWVGIGLLVGLLAIFGLRTLTDDEDGSEAAEEAGAVVEPGPGE